MVRKTQDDKIQSSFLMKPELLKRIKMTAVENDMTMTELIEQAVKMWMDQKT